MGKNTTANEMKHITGAKCSTTLRRASRLDSAKTREISEDNKCGPVPQHRGKSVADRTVLCTDTPGAPDTRRRRAAIIADSLFAELEQQSQPSDSVHIGEPPIPADMYHLDQCKQEKDRSPTLGRRTVPTWSYSPAPDTSLRQYSEQSDRSLLWQPSRGISPTVPSASDIAACADSPLRQRVLSESQSWSLSPDEADYCFSLPDNHGFASEPWQDSSKMYSRFSLSPSGVDTVVKEQLGTQLPPHDMHPRDQKRGYKPLSSLVVPRKPHSFLPTPVASTGTTASPSSNFDRRKYQHAMGKSSSFRIFAEPFKTTQR